MPKHMVFICYLAVNKERKIIDDTEHTLHVHLSEPSQFDCISSGYVFRLASDPKHHRQMLV
jgi:hypothetical protein